MTPVDMMVNIFLKNSENFHWGQISSDFLQTPSLSEKLEHIKQHLALINEKSFYFDYIKNKGQYITLLEAVLEEIEKALLQEYSEEAELLKTMFWDRCKDLMNFKNGTYTFSDVDLAFSLRSDYQHLPIFHDSKECVILIAFQDELIELREKVNYLNQVKQHFKECRF